jgi:hypothetical protein
MRTTRLNTPVTAIRGFHFLRRAKQAAPTAAAFITLALLLLSPSQSRAQQWATATNSNDIKNTNSGNVGVGTADPSFGGAVASRLTVSQADAGTGFALGNTSGVPRFALNGNSTGSWTMYDYAAGAWTAGITQKGGSVGVGTTNPDAYGFGAVSSYFTLQANATNQYAILFAIANGTGGAFVEGGNASIRRGAIGFEDGSNLVFYNNPTNSGSVVAEVGRLTTSDATAQGSVFKLTSAASQSNLVVNSGGANPGSVRLWRGGGQKWALFNNLDGADYFSVYDYTRGASDLVITTGGNVGVGTSPGANYKLDVSGGAHVSGDMTVDGNLAAKYQDVAEWVPSTQKLAAGTVVVLDPDHANHVLASTTSYDTSVAGVVSERPGIALGEGGEGKALVATTGRVRVKVDATRAPIRVGDLLVTSDKEGVAMRSEPVVVGGRKIHAPGTIIGKALEPLASGTGEILVLLSLQ